MSAWCGAELPVANLGSLELMVGAAATIRHPGDALVLDRAIPAMLFLGIVMMPFYYISKTHSVPVI